MRKTQNISSELNDGGVDMTVVKSSTYNLGWIDE